MSTAVPVGAQEIQTISFADGHCIERSIVGQWHKMSLTPITA